MPALKPSMAELGIAIYVYSNIFLMHALLYHYVLHLHVLKFTTRASYIASYIEFVALISYIKVKATPNESV